MIKVYVQINNELIDHNEFRAMMGCPQGSLVMLQTLVNEYNEKYNRQGEIVMFKGKKRLFC